MPKVSDLLSLVLSTAFLLTGYLGEEGRAESGSCQTKTEGKFECMEFTGNLPAYIPKLCGVGASRYTKWVGGQCPQDNVLGFCEIPRNDGVKQRNYCYRMAQLPDGDTLGYCRMGCKGTFSSGSTAPAVRRGAMSGSIGGGGSAVASSRGTGRTTGSRKYAIEQNTNRPGEDYEDLDLASPEPQLCAEACMKDAKCKAWTYVNPGVQSDNARCWLKDKIPPTAPDDNCVSGVKSKGSISGETSGIGGTVTGATVGSRKYAMEQNTNRPGEDYEDLDLVSPEPQLCAEACMKDAKCKAWTYVNPGVQSDNARCWLKDKVPPAAPDDNCVSGVKESNYKRPRF